MANSALIRHLTGPVPAVLLSVLLLVAVFLLSAAAQHSEVFGGFFSLLLLFNVVGIFGLLVLILVNLYRLMRQVRAQVLGSRLTMRLLGMFTLLAVIPLGVVYYFSVQFVNKGIDSWFDVRIEQALDDALLLGRASLEAIKEDKVRDLEELASRLDDATGDRALIRELDALREQGGFTEITLLSQDGRVVAWSSAEPSGLLPDRPSEAVLSKLRQGGVHASLEPAGTEGLQLRIAVPVIPLNVSQPTRILQVLEPLPLRYTKLGESVQSAFVDYERLVYLRDPLKFSFILTLTLVTLMTLLLALWGAIFSARRLAAPLRDLAEGTRAVANGDYSKQLPVSSTDELGVLVQSFNEMTRQIHQAQTAARRSQREAENQRTYLETVLAHLSSGVLSFDLAGRLLTQNTTANQILGVDLEGARSESLAQLAADNPRLEPFFNNVAEAMDRQVAEWQCETAVFGPRGRQVLICRGTRLPSERGRRGSGGYVIVFDDVTALIRAQRDAAWGEVARRLAHEIKNPLTPIQLSAERIRHKYLGKLPEAERETLDRATRTISEQVESMKSMVNAFSNYAQQKQMQPEPLDLNQLVRDVVELHKEKDSPIRMKLELDAALPELVADRGRLRQVLNNLVANARDALRGCERPVLEIRTRTIQDGDLAYAELAVKDNGTGFPADLLDRVFEPYVTTKEKGNGLGLAIVKRIVEEHGGALWAENDAEGGACVTLRLPLPPAQVASGLRSNNAHEGAA
jgi:nitrogen fixation/metabolism regulation signal transduction histidine kinase